MGSKQYRKNTKQVWKTKEWKTHTGESPIVKMK